jgi:TRAP-type transport system small permease protein
LDIFKKGLKIIEAIIEYICMGTLGIMVVIVFAQVICRYVFKFTPRWSEETSIICMIWISMLGMALGVRRHIHLAITEIVNLFPKTLRKVVYCFDEVAMIVFGVTITIYGGQLSAVTMSSTLPATQLPSGVLYAILPIMGVLVTFFSVINLFDVILNKNTGLGGKS